MYINLKNPARAKEQLTKLEETAKAAKNDSLNNDLLYTQANYYYTFGMNSQGDAYINRLIGQYKEQKNYAKVDESYKTLPAKQIMPDWWPALTTSTFFGRIL